MLNGITLFYIQAGISDTLEITNFVVSDSSTIENTVAFDVSGTVANGITVDGVTIQNSLI